MNKKHSQPAWQILQSSNIINRLLRNERRTKKKWANVLNGYWHFMFWIMLGGLVWSIWNRPNNTAWFNQPTTIFSFSFTHFSHKILFWNIYNCEYRTHALYVFRRISDGWQHIDELLFFLFRYFYNETIAKSTSSSLGIDIYVKVVNKNDTWKIQITVVSVTLTFVCILNFDLNDLIYASSCEQIVWRVL